MTSAERKAAEASAPPVQTGYYDPNNPGACFDSIVVFQLKTGHKYCIFIWFPTWIMINLMILLKKILLQVKRMFHPLLITTTLPRATLTPETRKMIKSPIIWFAFLWFLCLMYQMFKTKKDV